MKTFETWKEDSKRFLAFPSDSQSVHIIDEDGNNYGSWYTVESFKKNKIGAKASPLSKVKLSIHTFVEEKAI